MVVICFQISIFAQAETTEIDAKEDDFCCDLLSN